MSPDLKAALMGWSRRVMEDLGQQITVDGVPALARFSVDEDEMAVSLDTRIERGSAVTRDRGHFRVTQVMDEIGGVLKRAKIEAIKVLEK